MDIYDYIEKYIKDIDYNTPLFSDDIYEYVRSNLSRVKRSNFNTYLARYKNNNKELKRYGKGIYYKGKDTVFGSTNIDINELIITSYIKDKKDIYGYETGPSLYNKLGLTTQIPNKTYIVTNNNRRKLNEEENKSLLLIKPIETINKENYRYYQFLDILLNKYNVTIESDNLNDILKTYFKTNNLNFKDLIKYAYKYNNFDLYKKISLLANN